MDQNKICSACMSDTASLVSIDDVDLNSVKWSTKIQSIVPELVIILNIFAIFYIKFIL